MASRAHVIHDYPFGRQPPQRPRRAVWLHTNEEVVLPRSRNMSGAGALLVSALAASALTAGLAYAVYVSDVPALTTTEAAPLTSRWEPDPNLASAAITNQLSGPAYAAPSREGAVTMPEDGWADVPLTSDTGTASSGASREAWANDAAPGLQPAPIQQQLPSTPSMPATPDVEPPAELTPAPYPNPTTTPPEGFAPSAAPSEVTPPARDPENPYLDR